MKTLIRYSILALLSTMLVYTNTRAQTFEQRAKFLMDSLNAARAKLSKDEQKIHPQIYDMLLNYEKAVAAGKSKAEAARLFHNPF
ncbi:MAG: hypothetical protein M1470_02640 [Bacteroidetes bacterium]|nr:hypothetical protein [Bacteroidota bacterium]MCL5738929.1 hypothetical protein [Bacteroidota bacterium]